MINKLNREHTIGTIRAHAHPLESKPHDFDPLMEHIGDAPYVLLGEATHGTHEFYAARAQITKRLIEEKGFTIIALEADWPDTYRVNRYIRAHDAHDIREESSITALADFKRFPSWMWRNHDIVEFVGWLAQYNSKLSSQKNIVNIYGLDLYSLHRSMEIVINTLATYDAQAAQRARDRYACFDTYGNDPQMYGYFATLYPDQACKKQVLDQLLELTKKTADMSQELDLEQNARIVKNAEHYYRSLYEGSDHSWNVRDQHMMETFQMLINFSQHITQNPKVVVWAHNSHLGDARATQMSSYGQLNLGQLVRQRYGNQAVLVGFTTYTGSVSAASDWGNSVQRKFVRPAIQDSYEHLFHEAQIPNFLLLTKDSDSVRAILEQERLERAIGVIYAPKTERPSHYFYARLSDQFDAIIHYDTTRAVRPLDVTSEWEEGELPETFPTGF